MRAFTPEPTRSSSRSLGKEKVLRSQLLKSFGPPLSPKSQAAADATASANKRKAEAQSRNKDAEAKQKEKDQAIEDSRPSGSRRRDLKRQDQPKPGGRLQNVEYTTIEEEMAQRQRDKHQQLQELEGAAITALAALRKAGGKLDVIKRSEAKRIVERSKARKSRSPRRKSKGRRRGR